MLCPNCRRQMRAPVYRVGPIVLDTGAHRLFVDGDDVHLPPQEGALLRLLMERAGQVVPHEIVWFAISEDSQPRIVPVVLCRLRKLLGPHRSMIRTVWGEGFILEERAPVEGLHCEERRNTRRVAEAHA